jgi:thiol-disulfide isomerase/thioredoxin
MKRIVLCLFTAIILSATGIAQTAAPKTLQKEGYHITLTTPGYNGRLVYLTYHFGKNLNLQDSAFFNDKGVAVFKGEKSMPPGIYAIVFPGKTLSMDFLVDKEQVISINADTTKLASAEVIGSSAHTLFQEYQRYLSIKGRELQEARTSYNNATTKEDSTKYEAIYNQKNKELNEYRTLTVQNNPESMLAALFSAMNYPETPNKKPVSRQDTIDNYNHYRAHYWDGVTFMDPRIIRTPFFLPKFERYYREVLPQAPDSLIKDFDYKLLLARSAPEMYRFMLNWLTDEYLNPKYMGQDRILVHLFNKYHSQGLTPWLNEKQQETIRRRAYMVMLNLVGEKAANLEMVDSNNKARNLYDVVADYTLVVFWDPTCGHCKEELPRLDSAYRASWKAKGVKIYAVLTEDKKKEWVNYIKDHKLGEWYHVYQTKEKEKEIADAQQPGFRQSYDVIQTPTLLLLDKEKRIVGKKLSIKQMDELIDTRRAAKKN